MQRREPSNDSITLLRRRAARLIRRGEPRKAALALREVAALEPTGSNYVRLAHALSEIGRRDDALRALRQAAYCFRHDDMRGRARTVAKLILRLDPGDASARRRAAA